MHENKRDDELEKLLAELRQKRENPDAIKLSDIGNDLYGSMQAPQDVQQPQEYRPAWQPPEPQPETLQPPVIPVAQIRQAAGSMTREQMLQTAEFDFVKPEVRDQKRGTAAKSPGLAARRLRGALNAGPENDASAVDPINKTMVKPIIQQKADIQKEQMEREQRIAEALTDNSEKRRMAENHPLFTSSFSKEVIIPEETTEDAEARKQAQQFETSEFILDGYIQRAEKKGVLNVKDNLDDNFREFFGDTVIIDRQPLSDKAQKQRKIKDFVLAESEGEIGGPVFEDDELDQGDEFVEYRSEEETGQVLADLMRKKARESLRMALTGMAALLVVTLSLLARFGALPILLSDPLAFGISNAVLVLMAVIINAGVIFPGLLRLLTFRADAVSMTSFAALSALMEAGALVLQPVEPRGSFGSVAVLALFFAALGELVDASRILSNFRTVSQTYDKYAASVLDDQAFSNRLTRGLDVGGFRILMRRKTGFTDHFLAHAYSAGNTEFKVGIAASISVVIAILCGIFAGLRGDGLADILSVVCGVATLALPFTTTLTAALPISRMHRSLARVGAVVPGFSAVEEVCGANCVILAGREFFPRGNVMLHGIKTFERERIDKAILYAASVIVQSCDTMSHMFMNVIQGKTEMLYETDCVEYKPEQGFSYWIENNRVLLGNRELMKAHDIETPSRDYENRYTKSSTRDAMYLAVGGTLYAMFVISYSANSEVMEALANFEREGLFILVHTRDFNITAPRIAKLYKIPESIVAIVPEEHAAELTRRTEYTAHAPSALTHVGSLTSFIRGVSASNSLRTAAKLSSTIEFVGMLIGLIMGVTLTFLGSLLGLGMLPVLAFQLIWGALLTVLVFAHRY